MGEIIMRDWVIKECHVRAKSPSPIRQEPVPIRRVITPIQGLPNPIGQVVPLISPIRSYLSYCFDLHPPALFLVHNSTIIGQQDVKWSLSISPCHAHELTLCTAYTEYSIHQHIQHMTNTASTEYSTHPRLSVFPSFSWLRVDPEGSFSFQCASSHDRPPPASIPS